MAVAGPALQGRKRAQSDEQRQIPPTRRSSASASTERLERDRIRQQRDKGSDIR